MPDTRPATDRGLSLLGGWQLVEDGESIALGGREQRLCALLALTGSRARAQVAGTLWPESTDARALASLRRALAQTRDRCPGLVVADRTSVGLAPDVVVDVHLLRASAAQAGEPDAGADLLATLAGDPLLPGWYDEWVEGQRDELERLRVDALEHLARGALERGDTGLAEGAARAVARIEPWRESASELVIRGLLGRGDRAGAVRELERYREVLRVELGVVPSPALVALVDAPEPVPVPAPVPLDRPVPVVVPTQRRAPAQETVRPPARSAAPSSPQPPPPPDPTPPTGPAGLTARAAAARLAAGAVLVMAASLAIANLGPGAEPEPPSSVPDTAAQEQAAGAEVVKAVRQVLVRPVAAADGAAAFVVRATRRPARVRVEVADDSGSSVVRRVLVRSRDGQRLVVTGLDGGTYEWSATSPTASPVTGEVEVSEVPSGLVAAPEPSVRTTPTPSPSPSTTASPTSVPTVTATPPSPPPSTPHPTQQPNPQPSPPPSPTRPGPSSGPTDPGTQDPGLVG